MQGSPHVVVFYPSSLDEGSSFSVELESYDSKSLSKKTLKTDFITVKVQQSQTSKVEETQPIAESSVPPVAVDRAEVQLFVSLLMPMLVGFLALI